MPDIKPVMLLAVALLAGHAASADLNDPTRPSYVLQSPGAQAAPTSLRVSAVFISGDRRIAVINGQRVRVGDEVAGARVSAIAKNKVTLVRGERTFDVSLLNAPGRQ